MVTVHGYIDGIYYAVTVGTPRPEAAATIGVASGARRVIRLLELHAGREIPAAGIVLDVNDTASVIRTLEALTQVTHADPGEA